MDQVNIYDSFPGSLLSPYEIQLANKLCKWTFQVKNQSIYFIIFYFFYFTILILFDEVVSKYFFLPFLCAICFNMLH